MTILAELSPLDPESGERVLLRCAGTNDVTAAGWNNERWVPAIRRAPKISVKLFDAEFDGKASASVDRLEVALDALVMASADVDKLVWPSAPVALYRHTGSDAAQIVKGRVTDFSVDGLRLSLSLRIDDEPLATPVLAATYAGNGGAEGPPDLKGRVKPWLFGRAVNVEPVLIDAVNSVYQVSAYGAVSAMTACYERGASFGAAAGDHATYAALLGATIAPGQWATCLAGGYLRLGAPAAGLITVDADGDAVAGFVRKTGAILTRIAAALGVSGSLDAASLTALDAAVPRNIALFLTEQETLIDLAQRLAAPCNAAAGASLLGKLFVARVAFGSAVATLDAQARQMPPVSFVGEEPVFAPYKRVMLGAARTWRVHGNDEIAFAAPLFERGMWDVATVYYEGNIVTRGDGSRWLYIATTAQAGVTPGTDPAVWSQLAPANALEARGPYSGATSYEVGDIVLWRVADGGTGNSYVRIGSGNTTGVAPSDGAKWALFVEGGVPGADGQDGIDGTDGVDGADGKLVEFIWKRAATQPATPAGNGIPSGWSDDPPTGIDPLWMSKAKQELDGTLVAGETWSAPIRHDGPPGASTFSLLAYTNTTVGPDWVEKTAGLNTEWSGSAYTQEAIVGGCIASFEFPTAQGQFAGIDSFPSDNSGYADLDFAFHVNESGRVYAFASGSIPWASADGYHNAANIYQIHYDGAKVRWHVNGLVVHEVPTTANRTFWLDTSLLRIGSRVSNIRWAAAGARGTDGTDGINGNDGIFREFVWKRAASQPATPTGNGIPASWFDNPPSGSDPLWMSVARQELDGTLIGTWATPIRHDGPKGDTGDSGPPGYNAAQVQIFKRSATAPALPTAAATYTFATGALSGLNGGWSTTVPATDGNPLYVAVATASSTGASDTIAANEWSSPVILAQDGAGGTGANGLNSASVFLFKRSASAPSVPSTTATYTFASGALTGHDNGWTRTVPANDGNPLWVITATAASTTATDTIASGEWAAPQILAENGTDGQPGADAVVVSPPSLSWSIAASQNGAVGADLPKSVTLKVMKGSTDVTNSGLTSFALATPVGFTGALSGGNNQTFTMTTLSADTAKPVITVTHNGVVVGVVEITTVKQRQGAAAQQFTAGITGLNNTGSYVLAQSIDLAVPAGATLSMDAVVSYECLSGTYRPRLKATYQNLTDGGAETDFGGTNPADGELAGNGDPGSASLYPNSLSTGHASSKSYRVRLYSLRIAGTGSPSSVAGTMSVRTA